MSGVASFVNGFPGEHGSKVVAEDRWHYHPLCQGMSQVLPSVEIWTFSPHWGLASTSRNQDGRSVRPDSLFTAINVAHRGFSGDEIGHNTRAGYTYSPQRGGWAYCRGSAKAQRQSPKRNYQIRALSKQEIAHPAVFFPIKSASRKKERIKSQWAGPYDYPGG